MKTRTTLLIVSAVIAVLASYLVWTNVLLPYFDYQSEITHEPGRWAVIEDSHGHHLAVQPSSEAVWNQLVELSQNKGIKWVGGKVEEYGNRWGFRFTPDTITVADITVEGAQTWIQDISENFDYWANTFTQNVYVHAKVLEIHI
jgi:hypothetical protein